MPVPGTRDRRGGHLGEPQTELRTHSPCGAVSGAGGRPCGTQRGNGRGAMRSGGSRRPEKAGWVEEEHGDRAEE